MSKTQKYDRKQIYTIEEVLSKQIDPVGKYKRKEHKVNFDGDLIQMDSHRYWTFKKKGVTCKNCGLNGKFFAKEKCINDQSYHFNLYGIDEHGDEVLFTKDHIHPRSKGGRDDITNYDTMCYSCNYTKGSEIET